MGTVEEKYELITRRLAAEDISGGDQIKILLSEGRNLKCLWVTSPTVKPHVGYFAPLLKFADFLKAGCEITVVLLDLYSFLDNVKFPMAQVIQRMNYYEYTIMAALEAIGIPLSKVRFVQESSYQKSERWIVDQWQLLTLVPQQAVRASSGYLFHGSQEPDKDVWDLADLTLQCGRRADSVKLALEWKYHGTAGFERSVNNAFATAAHLADLITANPDFLLVSPNPLPCLQVCFYYAPGGQLASSIEENSRVTRTMIRELVAYGFMIDYAPGDRGSFFRAAINCKTLEGTVEGLVLALKRIEREVIGVRYVFGPPRNQTNSQIVKIYKALESS